VAADLARWIAVADGNDCGRGWKGGRLRGLRVEKSRRAGVFGRRVVAADLARRIAAVDGKAANCGGCAWRNHGVLAGGTTGPVDAYAKNIFYITKPVQNGKGHGIHVGKNFWTARF
jgi:hypothetical protein